MIINILYYNNYKSNTAHCIWSISPFILSSIATPIWALSRQSSADFEKKFYILWNHKFYSMYAINHPWKFQTRWEICNENPDFRFSIHFDWIDPKHWQIEFILVHQLFRSWCRLWWIEFYKNRNKQILKLNYNQKILDPVANLRQWLLSNEIER